LGQELQKIMVRKIARKKLNKLYENAERVFLIHYSCESFYDRQNGKTPRVTSIAVRNLASGQTESFSIHKVAEQRGIPFDEISSRYDELEKIMLDEFFSFVHAHQDNEWIHWNMRDINYGFAAIEHRYRVLGGEPIKMDESKKFDLSRCLIEIYGVRYIGHPRLQNLVEKNKISDIQFLSGEEKAVAFEERQYVKLHQSTLRKVDIFSNIFGRTLNKSLKTNARWQDTHSVNPKVIGEIIKEHWLFSILGFIATVISLASAVKYFF
jgi:hypothetical protein